MSSVLAQSLNSKLACPKCKNIYFTFRQKMMPNTSIVCSSCSEFLGTWGELKAEFFAHGGGDGVFEMHDGQIIRRG
jgi:ribosomal protein S27E